MISISRDLVETPVDIRNYTNYDEKYQEFVYPSIEVLMNYNIIVVTLISASR